MVANLMQYLARTPKQIGEIIRRRRRQLGLSQKQLGDKVRLRQATISKIESGEPATRLQTWLDVLGALGLEATIRPRTGTEANEIEKLF